MKRTIEVTETLETEQCPTCGIWFAMPADFQRQRRLDGQGFYCPVGHGQHYNNTLEKQLLDLKNQLSSERARGDQYREANQGLQRQLSATQGVITRIKNRVKNGVCPCCNRSFENLARHMHNQHPEWEPGKG